MRFVTYYEGNVQSLDLFDELIISIEGLSRTPIFSFDQAIDQIKFLRESKRKIIVEWDLLMDDLQFSKAQEIIQHLDLTSSDVVRVYDIGAFYAVKRMDVRVQPILEVGNNNARAIDSWINFFTQGRIDRVILSYEFSKSILQSITPNLTVESEILIAGNIPIFYSPRKLLSSTNEHVDAMAKSEESSHKGFKVLQNSCGTMMFNSKDIFLLDKFGELVETGVNYGRVDLRLCAKEQKQFIIDAIKSIKEGAQIVIPSEMKSLFIRGFFGTNKTDILFEKLKNRLFQESDETFVGEIVDHKKNEYMVLKRYSKDQNLFLGDNIKIVTPEFKEKKGKVRFLKDSMLGELSDSSNQDYIILNHISGACARSRVYKS